MIAETETTGDLRSRVELFLFHEASLLDQRLFESWLALYTETAFYWVPTQPDQKDPKHAVSLIYDDRRLLETRVRRLSHASLHAQNPPSRTSHLVSNVMIEPQDAEADEGLLIRSVFHVTEYRNDETRLFAGRYSHRLEPSDGSFRIRSKRVDLVNCDAGFRQISVLL